MSTRGKRKTLTSSDVPAAAVPATPTRRSTRSSPALAPTPAPGQEQSTAKKQKRATTKPDTPIKEEEDDQDDEGDDDEEEEAEVEEVAKPAPKKPAARGKKAAASPTASPALQPAAAPAAAAASKKAAATPVVAAPVAAKPAAASAKKNGKAAPQAAVKVEESDADMEEAEDEEDEEDAEEEQEDEEDDAEEDANSDSEVEDMEDDSEDEDGEDDDEDEDDEAAMKDEPDETQQAADAHKFGSALTSLLSKPLPKSVLEGKQAPVLLQDRTLSARHKIANPARALKKAAVERKLAKKYMYNKDHVIPQIDNIEKKLMRIATKGVVTLFNAVAKQQKEIKKAAEDTSDDKKKIDVSKSGFLQLLKTEGASVAAATSTSLPTPATMGGKMKKEPVIASAPAAAAPASNWKVLNEDYLMGGKMTDWDKAVHSSEDEDDE